ncbi:MAG TPA: nucleoside phosphorylase [Thermomicrobiaceae bacterium]|nr:nucleoside phosphorylase [Thermomicrobiaceae bacterium]
MPYPNFPGKHAEDALITPEQSLAYFRELGLFSGQLPEAAILVYQNSALRRIVANRDGERIEGMPHGFYRIPGFEDLPEVALCGEFGIGAPAAATTFEELIALGASRFISIGTAGGLQPDLPPGSFVLCDAAIRDEGVSHHYQPAAQYAHPSGELTARLAAELGRAGIVYRTGTSWTIDTPFRETVAEARHYAAQGVLTVEMEAAALCAVAAHRGVELATAFVVSDLLAESAWTPHFGHPIVRENLLRLFDIARATLS